MNKEEIKERIKMLLEEISANEDEISLMEKEIADLYEIVNQNKDEKI